MRITKRFLLLLVSGVSFAILQTLPHHVALAKQEPVGKEEYRENCATCHGLEGRGDGPVAKYLNVKTPDLTQLSRKHGGKFPLQKLFHTIDGRQTKGVHGDRAMPIWGDRYNVEATKEFGSYGSETAVRDRIVKLVEYLRTIQE
jgi:mono/diheme cytochrome c family protein